jgi:putative component of toxin-antitoxin plasmid stabilization module
MWGEVVRRFPETAQDSLGYELYRVQCGFNPNDWKPMTDIGAGVKEIRVRDEAGAFRMIYLATRPEGVYVLHCFQKSSSQAEHGFPTLFLWKPFGCSTRCMSVQPSTSLPLLTCCSIMKP